MNNGDKRTVSTDALETLGTILTTPQYRDAIHLAVEPVEAGEDMDAGDYIVVDYASGKPIARRAPMEYATGIVDPFIHPWVNKGQKFWFVMKPRQVHSLRHVWTHPAFPEGK